MAQPTKPRGDHPDHLAADDVRAIVRLLGEIAGLDTDSPGKRRFLMQGLAKLLAADYWGWVHFRDQAQGNPPMAFMTVVGGWESEAQLMKFGEAAFSPAVLEFNARMRIGSDVHRTRRREELFRDNEWFPSDLVRNYYEPAGLGEFLSSLYPLGDNILSSIIFLRRWGRAAFSRREVCIAHLITDEIDWLHRAGTDVAAVDRVNDLTLRQRLVLVHLMTGNGAKQIARKLSISPYTVNSHIKNIYSRFGAKSRGELLAQFMAGGPAVGRIRIDSRGPNGDIPKTASTL